MKQLFTVLFLLINYIAFAQTLERVEPPFWWSGMNNADLQLLVYGKDISKSEVSLSKYKGVKLAKVNKVKNPNYLFIDLEISEKASAGTFSINFKKGKGIVQSYDYVLKARRTGSAERKGFSPADVMYLITPDRFVNGNKENDSLDDMPDKLNRKDKNGRHGGDIQGIIDNLDYIDRMGFTAIWLNPLLENNMQRVSYHGYSTTDYYKIDPRYGSNEKYLELSRKAKEKGIGLIMDMIVNHCGSEHWWIKDFPMDDWVNFQDEFKKGEVVYSSHRKTTIQDPYVAEVDKEHFAGGWFDKTMPDLNQRNPYMAKYLIQNSIWWIEYADLYGVRMDTYPYPGADYMAEWSCAVMSEYPNLNIVGEEWHDNHTILSYWQKGQKNVDGYTSCLPSLMDFPLRTNVVKALMSPEGGFSSGWYAAYESLSNDYAYADPYNFVTFPDNHDMSRFYTQVQEKDDLFRLGIVYFLTMRGIPQIYYGTEILMKNPNSTEHGIIRSDFPGGWEGDQKNAFTGAGLTDVEKYHQDFFKKLLNWRKTAEAIHKGKVIHYHPRNSIYIYFRYTNSKKVMVVLSKNKEDVTLDLDRFSQGLGNGKKGTEILTGKSISLEKEIIVPAMSPMIIEVE